MASSSNTSVDVPGSASGTSTASVQSSSAASSKSSSSKSSSSKSSSSKSSSSGSSSKAVLKLLDGYRAVVCVESSRQALIYRESLSESKLVFVPEEYRQLCDYAFVTAADNCIVIPRHPFAYDFILLTTETVWVEFTCYIKNTPNLRPSSYAEYCKQKEFYAQGL